MNTFVTTSAHRAVPALALGLALTAGLAGCGSNTSTEASASGGSSSGSTPSDASSSNGSADPAGAQTLDITVKGDDVEPENKRIEVDKSQPLTLKITSDRAGELHVHSSPEQHVEFEAGTTTKQLSFTVPGVIELEEHKSDSLIAQLEVR